MTDFFLWIEGLSYAAWLRESGSLWAFPGYLLLHTLGMATMVGGATMISFALLGLWPRNVPIKPLVRLYPMMWTAFFVNLFTGGSIFFKDANSYGHNTDFYIKLALVTSGVVIMRRIQVAMTTDPQLDAGPVPSYLRTQALAGLACWFLAIVTGRLIAYVGPVPGL
ncbi:MAG: hypothetical protein AB7I50_08680 [Vicinamibacterales bacterium]